MRSVLFIHSDTPSLLRHSLVFSSQVDQTALPRWLNTVNLPLFCILLEQKNNGRVRYTGRWVGRANQSMAGTGGSQLHDLRDKRWLILYLSSGKNVVRNRSTIFETGDRRTSPPPSNSRRDLSTLLYQRHLKGTRRRKQELRSVGLAMPNGGESTCETTFRHTIVWDTNHFLFLFTV